MSDFTDLDDAPHPDSLIVLVVGSHLRAEIADRPLASRLRDLILAWQSQSDSLAPLFPIICTDLWYLNAPELMARPTIALGDPSVNAAVAYLSPHLPTAFVVDQSFRIHLDPEFIEPRACFWGINHAATASAMQTFASRYLDSFLRTIHNLSSASN
ncbi:MAG TPA: hypothetical protein VG711_09605 [Phycisphaerales bacterium]|nr:hypothetical protein [Phycisphaerales bacterium]